MIDAENRISVEYAEKRIDLQRRADELAMRLTGDDRLLVFELRSAASEAAELRAKVRAAIL